MTPSTFFLSQFGLLLAFAYFFAYTPTLLAQSDSIYRVEVFNQEVIEKLSDDITEENIRLNKRLVDLENQVAGQGDIMRVLKTANKERFETSVNNLSFRYEAGERVVNHIIKEINQFNLSFSQLQLQTEFSTLSDPTTYSEFNSSIKNSLDGLKNRKILPDLKDVDALKTYIPVLSNPIISTTISIASHFLAKYNQKSKINNENLVKLTCILNYTNQLKSEHQIITSNLQQLNDKLVAFRESAKSFFGEYLGAINYSGGYVKYVQDKNNLAHDFMAQYRSNFFDVVLADKDQVGIITYDTNKDDDVLFHIEQVKFFLNEYENLLLDIKDFIGNYEKFVQKQKTSNNEGCASYYKETQEIFKSIDNQLIQVQNNFKIVYEENRIDKNTKRILFGQ